MVSASPSPSPGLQIAQSRYDLRTSGPKVSKVRVGRVGLMVHVVWHDGLNLEYVPSCVHVCLALGGTVTLRHDDVL